MSFHEDLCRLGIGHAAENLALLNRIAVSLLFRDPSAPILHPSETNPDGTSSNIHTRVRRATVRTTTALSSVDSLH